MGRYITPAKTAITDTNCTDLVLETDGSLPVYPTKDNFLEIAKGNIPGHTTDRKFGKIEAVAAATPADIWEYGITSGAEVYTWTADGVADIDRVSSDNAGDTQDIVIEGLNILLVETIQTVTLTGQTPVALPTPLFRVNRMYNDNSVPLLGNVYCFVNGPVTGGVPNTVTDVRGYISIGTGQTLQSHYTVPVGKTLYFYGYESSLTKGGGATVVAGNIELVIRGFGKVNRTQADYDLVSGGSSNATSNFVTPLVIPQGVDIWARVDVTANNIGSSFAYTFVLVDDGF